MTRDPQRILDEIEMEANGETVIYRLEDGSRVAIIVEPGQRRPSFEEIEALVARLLRDD